jgi:hypothetical protein
MDKGFSDMKSKADSYATIMKKCFSQSQEAYQLGNRSLAKTLSEKGKQYKVLLDELNKKIKLIEKEYKNNKTPTVNENYVLNLHDHSEEELNYMMSKIKIKSDDYASKMKELFQNSQIAFTKGNKALAKELSEEGRNYKENLEILNQQQKQIYDKISLLKERQRQEKIIYYNKQFSHTNTSSIKDLDDEEDLLSFHRSEAEEFAMKMKKCFEDSQNEFKYGDKALAKYLSDQGNIFKGNMLKSNRMAKEIAFNFYNADRDFQEIDLHGLLVNEAIELLEERIKSLKQINAGYLIVIHGKGNHSDNNTAKIKFECYDYLEARRIPYVKDNPNEGCLTIIFN